MFERTPLNGVPDNVPEFDASQLREGEPLDPTGAPRIGIEIAINAGWQQHWIDLGGEG
jgi:hypothetical protein